MTHHLVASILLASTLLAGWDDPPAVDGSLPLESQLRREDPAALAQDAQRVGDARRGALVFYQPALQCANCHDRAAGQPPLGPDLAALGKPIPVAELVESIVNPSKTIKPGYETVTIVTSDGRTVVGLLVEDQPNVVVLRDPKERTKLVTIPKDQIEERNNRGPSLMPAGLVNALSSRQQFLDLVRYVIEIAEHGPERARLLQPDPALLASPLPDYEQNLDHRGLITGLDHRALERGEAIYERVCANCHGTKDRMGSLPTAPQLASATLKNGSDPYRMYRVLTDGFGQMAAQSWMVPRQKYDVIYYIRETYLKAGKPDRYVAIDAKYLDLLPAGASRGPRPAEIEPWVTMDYGQSLSATYEISRDGSNFAYKGIAIRLDGGQGGVSRGRAWVVYDHDTLRLAAAWTGSGFIDWNGINFNGRHQVHPQIVGKLQFANPNEPGWTNPENGEFAEARQHGRDGRVYGPLPRGWAHYRGLYRLQDRVILAYTVGSVDILETPGIETDLVHPENPIFTRTLEIGPSTRGLTMRVAPDRVAVSLIGDTQDRLIRREGFVLLHVPEAKNSRGIKLFISSGDSKALRDYAATASSPTALEPLTHGGPRRWPEVLKTQGVLGRNDGPLAVDVLPVPDQNPWLALLRPSALDFLPDGRRAAVSTWDGDVWLVDGINHPEKGLAWQRIASGLFQPLGLKVIAGRIYVTCRDQIVCLHDLNGDGETDFYENFNSDHQVTEHFHEFAMGLQTDPEGNFYYTKAARHGLPAVVPQHGTLLRVSKDGMRTEIVATGFRAPNGVCVNADSTFFLSDQEGFWTPKNRINWVKPGGFYGNMWGYHNITDSSDRAMEQPVCWITNAMDRSPAELLWVESTHPAWKPLRGALLSLSYGNGRIFVVPHEIVGGQMQGGVCALPIPPFPTGVMRGRFNPVDGHLYTCGLFGWAGDRTQAGGLYRVRATGKEIVSPIDLTARRNGLAITFSDPIDLKTAGNPAGYTAKTWSLKRTADYGSDHYNEQRAEITRVSVENDGRTVFLEIPHLKPTWCMEVTFSIRSQSGHLVDGVIHNTIHRMPK
jgi:putative heme-binding domain-containing protein